MYVLLFIPSVHLSMHLYHMNGFFFLSVTYVHFLVSHTHRVTHFPVTVLVLHQVKKKTRYDAFALIWYGQDKNVLGLEPLV